MKSSLRMVIGGVVIAGAFGALIYSGTQSGSLRAVPVSELRRADGTQGSFVGQHLRAVGFVTRTPVRKVPTQTQAGTVNVNYFSIDDHGATAHVEYADALPDTFRLGGPVQIDGEYIAPGRIRAVHVLTKCPSKYDADAQQQDQYRNQNQEAHPANREAPPSTREARRPN